jgi:hypothetical protein
MTQEQISAALDLLPQTGEISMDEYKEKLYAAQPDTGKEVLTHLLMKGAFQKRLVVDAKAGVKELYFSRKA